MSATSNPTLPEPVKLATVCEHRDQPEKARGLCQKCYRASQKAAAAASQLSRTDDTKDDRNESAVVHDLERDPEVKKIFYAIMWDWLKAAEIRPIYKVENGRKVRDYAMEYKMGELAQRKADKAATVLGRAYVVEKREEVKPVPLPLGGEVDDSGWGDADDDNLDDKGEE